MNNKCPVCSKPILYASFKSTNNVDTCSETCSRIYESTTSKHTSDVYNEDYYLRGRETGKSLYKDYRWMPELTIPMCARIVNHLGIINGDTILDFGCARGYLIKAFGILGYDAYGTEISQWARDNCDPAVKHKILCSDVTLGPDIVDWVIAKDVLEHVENVQQTVNELMYMARKGVFVVVPLSNKNGDPYVCKEYEADITHIHRLTLPTWAAMFTRPGWSVDSRYHLWYIKQNYHKRGLERANGFITCRRESMTYSE